MYTLTIRYPDRTLKTEIKEGQTLLSALQSAGVHELDAPCGGNGKCGKCLARVSGAVTPPGDAEKKKNPNYDSVRLACQTKAVGDCEVYLEERSASVATHGNACDFPVDSWSEGNYGIAVDIGTTTVAAFLCELWTGNKVFIESGLNDQRSFGADVISRSSFAMETDGGLEKERAAIVSQLNGFARKLCARAGIPLRASSAGPWSETPSCSTSSAGSPRTIAVALSGLSICSVISEAPRRLVLSAPTRLTYILLLQSPVMSAATSRRAFCPRAYARTGILICSWT